MAPPMHGAAQTFFPTRRFCSSITYSMRVCRAFPHEGSRRAIAERAVAIFVVSPVVIGCANRRQTCSCGATESR